MMPSKHSLTIVLVLENEIRSCSVLLFSGHHFEPRRPVHWSTDGDVGNKAIISEMARR